MTKRIIIIALVLTLGACKKIEQSGVMINIENQTNFTLDSVKLYYDTSSYNYGTILPDEKTEYVLFESMLDGAAVIADSANKKIFAGHLIPPNYYPLPVLAAGKYTLNIFPDSAQFYRYGAEFVKN